ncbi:MAG TPA: ABC transporter substrate-binding protein [Nevskiaceae bacterium]
MHNRGMGTWLLGATMAAALAAVVPLSASAAEVKIGVTISQTGPAASLGIPEAQTLTLVPKEVDGVKLKYIVLDDATNPTHAVQNFQQLTSDDGVDVVLGSSTTPTSLAMLNTAEKTKTPMITIAPFLHAGEAIKGPLKWAFQSPQRIGSMAKLTVEAMRKQHVKTLGFIGFSDAYGQDWLDVMRRDIEGTGIKLVDVERFARNDTSVTGQALKLVAANPDAILIAASSSPSVLPQQALKRSGYKGHIYQTFGSANTSVLNLCGADCNGMLLAAGPVLVAEQLEQSNPVRKPAMEYKTLYEDKYGKNTVSEFGSNMWDSVHLVMHAIPVALKTGAKPGTEQFRVAMRDAIEATHDLPLSGGVFNFSPTYHSGPNQHDAVMLEAVDGHWKYRPDL